MTEQAPQIVAILRAIEARLDDPDGRMQLSQDDTFRSQFLLVQMAEVQTQQREQILALTEVIAMLHGRTIEHSRSVTQHHVETLELLEALAGRIGDTAIALRAEQARQVIHAAEEERLAEIALSYAAANDLLAQARFDAAGLIGQALNRAEAQRAMDVDAAREVLKEAATGD